MMPEERAEEAYQRWILQVSDDLRRRIDGTPYHRAFVATVAEVISEVQQTVALGAGTAELPHRG